MKSKLNTLLAFVFVCACSSALANPTYTDSFYTRNVHCCSFTPWGPPPLGFLQYDVSESGLGGEFFATYRLPDYLWTTMSVDFSALVSTFREVVDCWGTQCNYSWDGTFNGGSARITADVFGPPNSTSLTFTGTVTGGTFTGYLLNYCGGSPNCGPGYGFPGVIINANVDGTWSNGWKSQGLMTMFEDYDGPSPNLLLTATVPEPGSLVILASGLTLLTGVLRRKLLP